MIVSGNILDPRGLSWLTKRLLHDDSAVVWRVVDDCWSDEVTLSGRHILTTDSKFVLVFADVLEEALDTLVLHRVLDGSEVYTFIIWTTDLEVRCKLGHGLECLLVDRFVNVDALRSDTNLSAVLERTKYQLRRHFRNVYIRKNNRCVVATELERHALQSRSTGGHDLLTSRDRTSEGDLGDVRMLCHHRSKSVIATKYLNKTWWEDLLCEFDWFQDRVRCEW